MKVARGIIIEVVGTISAAALLLASIVAFTVWGSNAPNHTLLHPAYWLVGAGAAFAMFAVVTYFTCQHYEERKEAERYENRYRLLRPIAEVATAGLRALEAERAKFPPPAT